MNIELDADPFSRVHIAYLGYGVNLFRDRIQYWLVVIRGIDEAPHEIALTSDELDELHRLTSQFRLNGISQ